MFNQCPCSKIWIPFKHRAKHLNGRNLKNKFYNISILCHLVIYEKWKSVEQELLKFDLQKSSSLLTRSNVSVQISEERSKEYAAEEPQASFFRQMIEQVYEMSKKIFWRLLLLYMILYTVSSFMTTKLEMERKIKTAQNFDETVQFLSRIDLNFSKKSF